MRRKRNTKRKRRKRRSLQKSKLMRRTRKKRKEVATMVMRRKEEGKMTENERSEKGRENKHVYVVHTYLYTGDGYNIDDKENM